LLSTIPASAEYIEAPNQPPSKPDHHMATTLLRPGLRTVMIPYLANATILIHTE
jgi:hypothetical protein